jgi:prepilin-type N-terminal cleavage/methylation domain-containing protein
MSIAAGDRRNPHVRRHGGIPKEAGIPMIRMFRDRLAQARSTDDGFTLIELLIVVVILGVLSGIVVFAVSAFNNDRKSVETASEAYFAKSTATPAAHAPDMATMVTAGYLKSVPSSNKYAITYTVVPAAGTTPENATVTSNLAGC